MPLANDMRPQCFEDMVGQQDLIGPDGLLCKLAKRKAHTSCVFYGPPGCGKTTAALIFAQSLKLPFYKLDATTAQVKDIREITEKGECSVIYLDEIQYFNKRQQQSLLSFVETGQIVLVAATTENPYSSVYKALLSRMTVFEFKAISEVDIRRMLVSIYKLKPLDHRALDVIARAAAGDARHALNLAETALNYYADKIYADNGDLKDDVISMEDILTILPDINQAAFDMSEQAHTELKGAFQKSIRGSDPDAAAFYLMRFLAAGDMVTPCRRLLVIASEDIGLADPFAQMHTLSCVLAAEKLGLPEAQKPLMQATIYLACAPKSNSVEKANQLALKDIRSGLGATIPANIAGEHPPTYKYPHDYPNHWVDQPYLPEDIKDTRYWLTGNNKKEQAMLSFVRDLWNPTS